MIRKITKVRDVGVYKAFDWPEELPKFTDFNLIYGWNYSGKTTLSRLFGVLEKPATKSKLGGVFEMECDDGVLVKSTEIEAPLNCRVFNRSFIERNFQVEHNAPAVYIVGDEANQLRDRINRLQEHKDRVARVSARLTQEKAEWERRVNDGLKRDGARAIADLVSERGFNRTGLNGLIAEVRSAPRDFILSDDDFDALKATANSSDSFAPLNHFVVPNIDIEGILARVEVLLGQTASNNAIEHLKRNPSMETWVRTGLALHESESQCGYCGNDIQPERIDLLAGHFSKEYEALVQSIKDEAQNLSSINLAVSLPSRGDVIHSLRDRYSTVILPIDDYVKTVKIVLEELVGRLNEKMINIEVKSSVSDLVSTDSSVIRSFSYTNIASEIRAIFTVHNEQVADLEATKNTAKLRLKKHSAASFFVDNNIADEEAVLKIIRLKQHKATKLDSSIAKRITEKEEEIKAHSVAVSRMNELITTILSGSNVSAVPLSDSEFEFRRGSEKAENLSEGERTAIAFCYFLLTLEDSGNLLADTVVFVDDPISSLDSNHIYSIYALIIERLKGKCQQLFVSTHNSEFFNLLKDEAVKGNRNFKTGHEGYYTQRSCDAEGEPFSQLVKLPDSLRKFKSEYQFVFSMLHEFSNSPAPTLHEAYTAPTLVRKFLESYLGFRNPAAGSWSSKLYLLMDDEVERREATKFADDASHLQGATRAVQHADYVSSAKEIVGKVLTALESKDNEHYTNLVELFG